MTAITEERKYNRKRLLITLKTIYGLEDVLVDELHELGFEEVTKLNRAVQLTGDWRDVYYLNLHIRCAISVLVEIAKFSIREEKDLYDKCMNIDWTSYFDVKKTFAVKGSVHSKIFRHTQYPNLLMKDAIVDTFRKKVNERPSISTKTPHLVFDLYIHETDVVISLNTSGLPLYQRGYRQSVGEAPLNEVVAAGLIRLSGWDRKSPFYDPFCGSGTLLAEAALLAAGIPSNIERTHYAFKNLTNFKPDVWNEIYEAAPRYTRKLDVSITGSDISSEMVLKARRNLRGLSIGRFVDVEVKSFDEVRKKAPGKATVITNPPYGERIGENVETMYEELGNWMKNHFVDSECWILSSNIDALKSVGLKPSRKIKVYNGSLECEFRSYRIFEGSKANFASKTED